MIGLALAAVIQLLTEHYTSTRRRPVKDIVEASLTGPATNVLAGSSEGLESSVWSILAIGAAIIGCFYLGDGLNQQLFFVSLAGIGMLSVVGVIVSMDTYGPVSDNAQGIAEMSGDVTGRGAEILRAWTRSGTRPRPSPRESRSPPRSRGGRRCSVSFQDAAHLNASGSTFPGAGRDLDRRIRDVPFSSFAIRAVGRTASQVVMEVRKQFREHPGDHGLHREARLQRGRGHRDALLASRADDAGDPRGPSPSSSGSC